MSTSALTFIWSATEHTMRPFGVGMLRRADEQYGDGEIIRLAEPVDRTQQAEGFFFANLHSMWQSLPERYADKWFAESDEALRAYALMKTGFANIEDFPCKNAGEAQRWAARLQPMIEYSITEVRGNVVRRYTAKSQSRKAMPGKATFAESSSKVLNFIADLIELPRDAEERNTNELR
jgi:hypothetical protein